MEDEHVFLVITDPVVHHNLVRYHWLSHICFLCAMKDILGIDGFQTKIKSKLFVAQVKIWKVTK